MKQRFFTGLGIMAVIILAIASCAISPYIFDAFIGIITVFAAIEFSQLLTKSKYYNFMSVIGAYPTVFFVIFMLSMHYKLSLYMLVLLEVCAIILIALGCYIVSLIFRCLKFTPCLNTFIN